MASLIRHLDVPPRDAYERILAAAGPAGLEVTMADPEALDIAMRLPGHRDTPRLSVSVVDGGLGVTSVHAEWGHASPRLSRRVHRMLRRAGAR